MRYTLIGMTKIGIQSDFETGTPKLMNKWLGVRYTVNTLLPICYA